MELREYLRVLRRRWTLIVLIALLALGVAIVLTAVTKKTYQATARDFVNVPVSASTNDNSALAAASQFAQARVKSYVGLSDSDAVLRPVISQLKLKNTTVTDLAEKITIENPVDTVLLDISATDHDPAQAARLSNAVAEQLKTTIERLEVARTSSQSQVTVTVIRTATPPTSAVSPRPVLNYALGLVIGLALGVVIAIARERLDNGVRRVDDLATITGRVPLGAIPYAEELADNPLVALKARSPLAEAYRSIRTRIEFVDVDNPPKRIVVTSSVPGEGKSVGACNLAITVAATGLRVCLVEGDLRRPRVAGYLGFDASVGLSDVLANRYQLDDVLVPWSDGHLTVLPAGTTPPDPSDLLGSRQMRELLDQLGARFDMIIIDAPPLLPVTDAAVLAAQVDGALLMVRLGSTRRPEVSRSLEALEQANVRLLGTVATFVSARSDDYGSSYGYGYLDDENETVAPEIDALLSPLPDPPAAEVPAPALVAVQAPAQGPVQAPAQAPARTPAKAAGKARVKGRAKAPAKVAAPDPVEPEPELAPEPEPTVEPDQPVDDAPVVDAPVVDDPVDEAPADEAPVDEAPADETPADEALADETPADEAPADDTPADETPVDAPADEAPADEAPADDAAEPAPPTNPTVATARAAKNGQPARKTANGKSSGSRRSRARQASRNQSR